MFPVRRLLSNKMVQNGLRRWVSGGQPLTALSDDELAMKEHVRKLAVEQIAPLVRKMDDEHRIDDGIRKMLFENGLMGMEVGTEYGGSGCGFLAMMLAVEELSRVDASVAAYVDIHNTLVNSLLLKLGTEEQKKKYLPKLCAEYAGSFCLTEPGSGSDAFSLKTVAKPDGDDFLITGSKMWISNSDVAGVFLVMANADPSKGYKGITCFIVERESEGLTVAKPEDKLGIRASGTCMVHFDNVRVNRASILGEYGHGYKYAAGFLNEGRIGIAAQMIGICQGILDATVPYTLDRKQFGNPIYAYQGVSYEVAKMFTNVEAARLMMYNASRLKENGQDFVKEAAMAKYFASELAQKVTGKCIDLMGGVGFTRDYPHEKFFRDAKIGTIYEGTSNMQLQTIAKLIQRQYQ